MNRKANIEFNVEDKETVVNWFTTFCCIAEVQHDNLWIYVRVGTKFKDTLEKFIKDNPNIAIDAVVDQDEECYAENCRTEYCVRNGKIITVGDNNGKMYKSKIILMNKLMDKRIEFKVNTHGDIEILPTENPPSITLCQVTFTPMLITIKGKQKEWQIEAESERLEKVFDKFVSCVFYNQGVNDISTIVDIWIEECTEKHTCPICGKKIPMLSTEWYDVVNINDGNDVYDSICENCAKSNTSFDIYKKTGGILLDDYDTEIGYDIRTFEKLKQKLEMAKK